MIDVEVQPLAVDLDDHEAGLDRVAGRQVLARADDQAARRAVGLLAQIGAEPAARGPVSDPADDPLRALLQLLLRARVGVRGVVVDDGDRVLDREEAALEGVLRRGPAAGEGLPVERAEVALGERRQLGLQAAGRTDHPEREVRADDEGERRGVRRGEEGNRYRRRRGVEEAERQADGLAQVLGGGRQDESVERRIELDGQRVGADAAALEQVDPAALVTPPAGVAEDEALVRLGQDLDGGAQVVARAGAGRDQRAGAPRARHPAHAVELGGGDARVGQRGARSPGDRAA